jgi:competence protein ComEC
MGFILSFSVVTGILLLIPIFYRPTTEVLPVDPYLPRANSFIRELVRGSIRWIWALAAVSLACWMVSFPLTAHFFNVFSPVALIGNLFVVPITFVVVVTGFLSMVTGLLNGWVSEVFNHANVVFVEVLLRIVGIMADVRGGHLFVRSPPWIWIVSYYLLLVGFVGLRDRRRGLPATLAFALVAGWLFAGAFAGVAGVRVLNRNGALSVDLEQGRGMPLLFDPGSRKRSHNLLSALKKRGINRIGVIVLSKAIHSRAGVVPALLERCRVGEVMFARLDGDSDLLEEILVAAHARRVKVSQLMRGSGARVTSTARWEVLSPGIEDDVHDAPCVLRILYKDIPLLVVSDLSPGAAYHLTRLPSDLRASAVVEGAYSFRGVHTDFFLDSVGPSLLLSPERFVARSASEMEVFRNVELVEVIEGESVMLIPAAGGQPGYTIEATGRQGR